MAAAQHQSWSEEELKFGLKRLNQAKREVSRIENTLAVEMGTLKLGWGGEASEAFQRAYLAFQDTYIQTKKDLAFIEDVFQHSLRDYVATEAETVADVSAVARQINY